MLILDFEKAIKLKPFSDVAYYNHGLALYNLNKIDDSFESFDRAVKLNPRNIEALNNHSYLLFIQKKYTEAVLGFSQVLRINPNFKQAKENLELIILPKKLETLLPKLKPVGFKTAQALGNITLSA